MNTMTEDRRHIPLGTYLRPDQIEALDGLARRRDLSRSQLIRRAIDQFLREASDETVRSDP